MPALGDEPFHAVFIRAPIIERAGDDVTRLATLPDGTIVAAERGNLLATAFHPELTADPRFHQYFLEKVAARGNEGAASPELVAVGERT